MTTDSDQRTETWKPIPGFSRYEAGDLGHVRSAVTGKTLATRVSNSGYLLVKPYDDSGKQQTRSVHSLVLLTFAGAPPDGMETLHGKGGPLDNRWPENIRYGTKQENDAERAAALAAAGRAANGGRLVAPKPPARCIRCGDLLGSSTGRRCHDCIVAIGVEAARLMRAGATLEAANEQLGYAKPAYLHVLAVKYGGWGQCPHCPHCHGRRSWLRRVFTLGHRRIGDTQSLTEGHKRGGNAQ